MSNTDPIRIAVDLTNPGQFFACCGLLELADRLSPGAEGWFERGEFCLRCDGSLGVILEALICSPPEELLKIGHLSIKPIIAPLALKFHGDSTSRFVVDFWTKIITKSGTVQVVAAPPWNMWSGNQKSLPIWLQLRDELRLMVANAKSRSANVFRDTRPLTGRFGFDSTAAWNAQDVGFSPNDQGISVESSPAIELLAAVGLQRFLPTVVDGEIRYQTWTIPASPAIASAFACGGIQSPNAAYHFSIVDRGQYSAFGKARPSKGEPLNV